MSEMWEGKKYKVGGLLMDGERFRQLTCQGASFGEAKKIIVKENLLKAAQEAETFEDLRKIVESVIGQL